MIVENKPHIYFGFGCWCVTRNGSSFLLFVKARKFADKLQAKRHA